MITGKKDIRKSTIDELKSFLLDRNEKAFRAKQIYEWLWKKSARSFEEMTNLSKKLRQLLASEFTINAVRVDSQQYSSDGTIKFSFLLFDDNIIEGVLIPTQNRITACISSQVGCTLSCEFCATGKIGWKRNLGFDEIYDQVAIISKLALEKNNLPVSNIVYMGMGEPLLNYENIIKSIEKITSDKGLGMSPQRVTVSTVGIPKMIKRLGDDNVRINLALSLHAANDKKRNIIIPTNKQNPVSSLIESLKYYHDKTGKRITIEYILLRDFNDSLNDAKELALFCKNFPVKINLIEYNDVPETGFYKSSGEKTDTFFNFLKSKNIIVNVRKSMGKDIDAACGQLACKKGKM